MGNKKISTLYYMETFLLLGFFIALTLVLSRVFVNSKLLSQNARDLTNAVCIAENVAEVVKVGESKEEIFTLLKENMDLEEKDADQGSLSFDLNLNPKKDGYYQVELKLSEDGYEGEIRISHNDKEIFTLEVGNYPTEVEHEQ